MGIEKFRDVTLSALIFFSFLSHGMAAAVDLNTWVAESYDAVSGFGSGSWTVAPGGDSVFQSVNGQPTVFYSDFSAINTEVTGTINVAGGTGDNDYIGFVLGFNPDDSVNSAADYLLVDWKKSTQAFNFGAPSSTPGTTANVGLAVSRVTGIPTADEFWGHVDFASDTGGEVVELARGNTLGSTGWGTNVDYEFKFEFHPTSLKISVDNVLEVDISGSFSNGRLGFYNFSQQSVTYSAFEVDDVPDPNPPVPEPASFVMLILGVVGLIRLRKR